MTFVAGWLFCLASFAQDYEVRLHRPLQVGYKESISLDCTEVQESSMAAGGKIIMHEKKNSSVRLDATSTVLAVNSKGRATHRSFEVERFFLTVAGIQKQLLPRGTLLITSNAPNKILFLVNGKPVTTELSNALGMVLSTSIVNETTDDDAFGIRERKRVGESWDINASSARKAFGSDTRTALTNLQGKVTLREVVTNAPVPFMKVAVDITGTFVASIAESNLVSQESRMTIKITENLPLESSLHSLGQTSEFSLLMVDIRKAPNTPLVEQRMAVRRSSTGRGTPLR